jgi:hypothetical protein
MDQPEVKIWVVEANIHVRNLDAEVDKGSARTVIDRGLVGPKR